MPKRNKQIVFKVNSDEERILNENCKKLGMDRSVYLRFVIKFSWKINQIIEKQLLEQEEVVKNE